MDFGHTEGFPECRVAREGEDMMARRFRGFWGLLVLGVAFALVVGACGGDEEPAAPPETVVVTSIVEVEVEVPGETVTEIVEVEVEVPGETITGVAPLSWTVRDLLSTGW
ncbi:MAG: hypothetical protein OXI84_10000, partial [bacterium]|nr:hypothetical protein [bacterium]